MKNCHRGFNPFKPYSPIGIFFLSFLLVINFSGCSDITGKKTPTSTTESKGSTLYVVNAGDGSLLAFDPPPNNTATNVISVLPQGNVSPSRRFPGGLAGPSGLFLDRTTDTLYVANAGQNAILIYENASTLNPLAGLAAATRTIAGPKTGLNRPFAVVYNPNPDDPNNPASPKNPQIYIANTDDNRILIFEEKCPGAPSSLNGDISPCRTISGASTLLDYPRGLALDADRDILYVSNMGGNSILAFNNISGPTQGNVSPDRVIASHADATATESMLQLPFGLFIDSTNDQLYAVKAGGNQPAIFIYENASIKGNTPVACASTPSLCGVRPERLLTTRNSNLPSDCTASSAPTECATAQLAQPAGIDVDIARSRIYVANSNNTNNVNITGNNNAGSTSLLIFNLKDDNNNDRCTVAMHICNIAPDQRIGGDVTGDNKTTLTNAFGVVVNTQRDLIYLSNPTVNNILVFSLEGNIAPIKINSGESNLSGQGTKLEQPTSLFYDKNMDRLYVANFNSTSLPTPTPNITVYDHISSRFFSNTPPSWTVTGPPSDIQGPRAVYLDRTRHLLIILSGNAIDPKLQIYNINSIPGFPLDSPTVSAGTAITLPSPTKTFATAQGLHRPKAMAVDEERGFVYIVQDCDANNQSQCSTFQPNGNRIVVYNLNDLSLTAPIRTISGTLTGLNRPFGVFIDTIRDILYVTNTGSVGQNINSILAFHNASISNGNIAPDQVFSSSSSATAADALNTPTAPSVDTAADRLFLINRGNNSIYIYENASTRNGSLEPDRKIAGNATSLLFPSGGSGGDGTDVTGALLIDVNRGKETIFVGQPKDPTLNFRGAFLIFSVEGNIAPSRILSGGGTPLAGPSAIVASSNTLYVANQGNPNITADDSISIFTTANQVEQNTIAPQSITNQLNNPAGLALDSDRGHLYVSNGGTDCTNTATPCNSILVFDTTNLGGGASPQRIISSTLLDAPRGLAFDAVRKILYVANSKGQSILVYKNADTLTGGTQPDFEVTGFQNPIAVAIDPDRDILYIVDQGTKEIGVIESASNEDGNGAERVITGSFMTTPSSLFLDPQNDLLYVADQGANMVYIFTGASSAEGAANHTTLAGNNTGLNQPVSLAAESLGAP